MKVLWRILWFGRNILSLHLFVACSPLLQPLITYWSWPTGCRFIMRAGTGDSILCCDYVSGGCTDSVVLSLLSPLCFIRALWHHACMQDTTHTIIAFLPSICPLIWAHVLHITWISAPWTAAASVDEAHLISALLGSWREDEEVWVFDHEAPENQLRMKF